MINELNVYKENKEKIWIDFSKMVLDFLKRKVPEIHAEDLRQEIFIKILKNISQLREEQKITDWIYQITRNTIADFYRKVYREKNNLQVPTETETFTEIKEQHLYCCLLPFIKEMPAHLKVVIEGYLDGKKLQEIADEIGITLSACKSRVRKAKELLKQNFVSCCQYKIGKDGKLIGEQDCPNCS